MQDFANQKILLGICGGIAAYKSAYLVRELMRLGAEVRVVMTKSAQKFITPLTFQALSNHEVRDELFDAQAEHAMGHIELARWADCILIAPTTANFLAKMAHGIADDLLSTLLLVAQTPVVMCPAMNPSMWKHPATVKNCEILMDQGVILIPPEEGMHACGEEGFGRMPDISNIINTLRLLSLGLCLKGQSVLITAGPTREAIDPVRYLSNYSSGKMGYALAIAALRAGAKVTLISGPTTCPPPPGVSLYKVDCAQQMLQAVMQHLHPGTIFIGAAAVADYNVSSMAPEKLKKKQHPTLELSLKTGPDILAQVVSSKKASYVIGFAAETTQVLQHAQEKLITKKLDMIVANQVGKEMGFETDDNQVTILTAQEQIDIKRNHKIRIAGDIISILANHLGRSYEATHDASYTTENS